MRHRRLGVKIKWPTKKKEEKKEASDLLPAIKTVVCHLVAHKISPHTNLATTLAPLYGLELNVI